MAAFLYLAFVLSGAAGLIYESVWSRYLGLFVGHSAYAQIIVLVIFMGGMALGAITVGRRSERLRQPLVWYAVVELAVGMIGLVFHDAFTVATSIAYDSIFPALSAGWLVTAVKWVIAGLLILPQSVLLGTTFPLVAAGVVRMAGVAPGRALAMLYFANSLGAAIGVLLAGFVLIAAAGLPGTLLSAVIANLVVGLAVLVTVRAHPADVQTGLELRPVAPRAQRMAGDSLAALMLAVSFGTAVASFIYEIAWIRMLSLVLGSATHSFELMLSAFILGLALGAFWIRRRIDRLADPLATLGIVQWVMGTLAIATLPLYLASFGWTADIFQTFGITDHGYRGFSIARYAICLAVMLPATFCAGITLPLITRTLITSPTGERAIGLVYGVNTLGSIVGVALAGLVLMPLVGVKALLVVGAAIDMALGLTLLARRRGWRRRSITAPLPRRALIVAAASLLVIAATLVGARFDERLLASGVFRTRALPLTATDSVEFYADGRTATVAILRDRATGSAAVTTNGKPDGMVSGDWMFAGRRRPLPRVIGGDESNLILAGIVPLAYRPDARRVAVIGQGTGMASHVMLGSPTIEELVTVDIEPAMVDASRHFYPANRRVFDDPRSRFVIDDAKSYFASRRVRYDVIVSQPSHPWVSGVSGLFTVEFYQRLAAYLADDGVIAQWLHLYDIDDQLVLSVLAAMHATFPSYEIHYLSDHDVLIVAGNGRTLRAPDWSVAGLVALRADMPHIRPITGEAFDGARVANRAAFAPLLDRGIAPNSDFYPVLDLGAERARYLASRADGFARLHAERIDVVGAMTNRRTPFGGDLIGAIGGVPRLRALAFGARLRAARAGVALDSLARNVTVEQAIFRATSLERFYASGTPPGSWETFVRLALDAERDLHLGTAGVADERFYRPLFAYLRAAGAPGEAVASISFAYGLARWDFDRARRAGDTLAVALARGTEWVPSDMLRDGLVVANLRAGDPVSARRALDGLRRFSTRPPGSLRSLLLEAYVMNAEDASRTAMLVPGGRSVEPE